MREVVIVEAVRTPVGKRNGGLAGVHPVDLSAHVLGALADRSGIDPEVIDDVIWGCSAQMGLQGGDMGRMAALDAGFDVKASGVTLDADTLAAIDAALGDAVFSDPENTYEVSPKQRVA